MKEAYFIISLLLFNIFQLSAQDSSCPVLEVPVTFDTINGIVNIVENQQINTQNCKICINIFIDKGSKVENLMMQINTNGKAPKPEEIVPIINEDNKLKKRDEVFNTVMADKDLKICFEPLIDEIKKSGRSYTIFASRDNNSIFLTIPYNEYELRKYGLKIEYLAKEGITRIEEFGKLYYLKQDGTPLIIKNGEPERYDEATDFSSGIAIVGQLNPTMTRYLLNLSGQKTAFVFDSYQIGFGNKNVILLKTSYNKYYLANVALQKISGEYNDIKPAESKFQSDRYTYYYVNNGDYDKGLLVVDQNGKVIKVVDKQNKAELWGDDLINSYTFGKSKIFDVQNAKELYSGNKELYYNRDFNDGDFWFATEPAKDSVYSFTKFKYGRFFNKTRTIFPPEYNFIGYLDDNGYIIVGKDLKNQGRKKPKFYYTLVDLNQNPVYKKKYTDLNYSDSKGYILFKDNKFKYGFMDTNEKVILPAIYDKARDFGMYGLAWVGFDDGRCGLINRSGEFTEVKNAVKFDQYFYNSDKYEYYEIPDFNKYGITITKIPSGDYFTYRIVSYKKKLLYVSDGRKLLVRDSEIENVCLITDDKDLFMYFKDGEFYMKDFQKVIRPYKNGYTAAKCSNFGFCLIDSKGQQYGNCMPYDYISDVLDNQLMIVGNNGKKGIIKITTDEKLVDILLDDISYENGVFNCRDGDETFVIKCIADDKILRRVSGNENSYNRIVLKQKR